MVDRVKGNGGTAGKYSRVTEVITELVAVKCEDIQGEDFLVLGPIAKKHSQEYNTDFLIVNIHRLTPDGEIVTDEEGKPKAFGLVAGGVVLFQKFETLNAMYLQDARRFPLLARIVERKPPGKRAFLDIE